MTNDKLWLIVTRRKSWPIMCMCRMGTSRERKVSEKSQLFNLLRQSIANLITKSKLNQIINSDPFFSHMISWLKGHVWKTLWFRCDHSIQQCKLNQLRFMFSGSHLEEVAVNLQTVLQLYSKTSARFWQIAIKFLFRKEKREKIVCKWKHGVNEWRNWNISQQVNKHQNNKDSAGENYQHSQIS